MEKKAQIQQKLEVVKNHFEKIKATVKRNQRFIWIALAMIAVAVAIGFVNGKIKNLPHELVYVLGIIQGIIIVVLLWAATMAIYLWARKKWAHTKYAIEIIFVSFVVLAGAIILLIGFYNKGDDGAKTFFEAVYTTIGNVTFEGLTGDLTGYCEVAFFGWAIYAGLTFLSIITAKTSYEAFSYVKLRMSEEGKDVYVFSALTEETLLLAESIEKEKGTENCVIVFAGQSLEPFDRKDDLCREVMAKGYAYWSFSKGSKKTIAEILHLDNKNAEDYERRFVIFAFESKEHIPCEEENMELVFNDVEARIKKMDDIRKTENIRKKEKLIKKNKLRIEYYILTKRNINYEAYDYKNRQFLCKYFDILESITVKGVSLTEKELKSLLDNSKSTGFKEYILSSKQERKAIEKQKDDSALYSKWSNAQNKEYFQYILKALEKEYSNKIVINVWSEASAISKEAARVASDFIVSKIKSWEDEPGKGLPSVNKSENKRDYTKPDFNIWCLGFGPTAQAIAKQLYCQSTYVDKNGWASLVKIDAYDKNMKEIAGLFKKEHPMSLFAGDLYDKTVKAIAKLLEKEYENSDSINSVKAQKDKIDQMAYGQKNPNKALIQKEMMYPLYHFHDIDCRDTKFIEDFDKAIGKDSSTSSQETQNENNETQQINKEDSDKAQENKTNRPDVFVIATGDDYNNIRVANAIIQDTVSEKIEENTRQIIFINIWDDKNNDLVLTCGGQWDEKHKHLTIMHGENTILEVFLIGNNKDIYSVEIVDINKPSKYHYSYELVSGWIDKTHNELDNTFNNVIEQYNKENDNKITDEGKQTIIEIAKDIISKLKEGVHQGNELEKNKENEIISWLASVRRGFLGNEKLEVEKVDLKDPYDKAKFTINILVNKLKETNEQGKPTEEKESIGKYNVLDIWKKESNKQADLYQQVIKGIIGDIEFDKQKKEATVRTYFRLSQMEHMRWSRAHIVGGWYYKDSETTRELLKQHKCIVPYQVLKDETYLYDTMNILMAEKQETKQSK